mgnify:CR=1 FL=1
MEKGYLCEKRCPFFVPGYRYADKGQGGKKHENLWGKEILFSLLPLRSRFVGEVAGGGSFSQNVPPPVFSLHFIQ